MSRQVSPEELLVGVEGLALLRGLYEDDGEAARRRLAEVQELMSTCGAAGGGDAIAELDPRAGYARWAPTYDGPGNPIVALEEPAVRDLLASVPPGRALDAACGTGRHARHLVHGGHDVLGVDLTPEMLDRAIASVPGARFAVGDLAALPAADSSFDLVVCGLALAHLPRLQPAIGELARVLRPGGMLVVSVLHPCLALLGWNSAFVASDGGRAFVREHPHCHSDYMDAMAVAGLDAQACLEPRLAAEHAPTKRRAYARLPEATVQAFTGLPAVLVWSARRRR